MCLWIIPERTFLPMYPYLYWGGSNEAITRRFCCFSASEKSPVRLRVSGAARASRHRKAAENDQTGLLRRDAWCLIERRTQTGTTQETKAGRETNSWVG